MPGITVASGSGPREPRGTAPPRVSRQLAGCILWLPPKAELRGNYGPDLEAERCHHPVVILSPTAKDGKVVYLMMTSFGGTDLETRFNHHMSHLRLEYLPISPSPAHPDNGMLLTLENPFPGLRKKSYVKTKIQYNILYTSLWAYDRHGHEYVLSRRSYHELIEYAKFSPPTPHPASNTVSSPGRVWRHEPALPITRERSGSYSEYVSAQRGLESGLGGTSRVHHSVSALNTPGRYHRPAIGWEGVQSNERDPLLSMSSYGYPRNSYSVYPGNYTSGHSTYTYRASARAGYQGLESLESSNRALFWKRLKRLIWVVLALIGMYAAYRGVYWLVEAAKETGSAIKDGIQDIGSKIGEFWSRLGGSLGRS